MNIIGGTAISVPAASSNQIRIDANLGGNGTANTLSRSDHDHDSRYLQLTGGSISTNNGTQVISVTNTGSGRGIWVSSSGTAIYGTSASGIPGYFEITSSGNSGTALYARTPGSGNAIEGSAGGGGAGVRGFAAVGDGVIGEAGSSGYSGVLGRNTLGGTGVFAESGGGNAFRANLTSSGGNIFWGASLGTNKVRIDNTGKGFFNGGTQTGGADFAESMEITGSMDDYEPGDVLVIGQSRTRTVEKSMRAYSTLVAGVFSTKPGILGTERTIDEVIDKEIPVAVVGIVPCKVSAENGSVNIGDLLTTSNTPAYAMKATEPRVGTILGKVLEPLPSGKGKIRVLVTLQ